MLEERREGGKEGRDGMREKMWNFDFDCLRTGENGVDNRSKISESMLYTLS